jgi:8-oxo-dGTP pyrophosphatase MutT (NUDIX family)
MPDLLADIGDLIARIEPEDEAEIQDRSEALAWLAGTADVFRRQSAPVEPARHLVSYFAVVDRHSGYVLLGDHRKSVLWLPSGGHVEPGESPIRTVRRECREELGIEAEFLDPPGEVPLFITITETVGQGDQHTDVSLWFCLSARTA